MKTSDRRSLENRSSVDQLPLEQMSLVEEPPSLHVWVDRRHCRSIVLIFEMYIQLLGHSLGFGWGENTASEESERICSFVWPIVKAPTWPLVTSTVLYGFPIK